ncbi:extracellular signal-regulated kinase 1/2 [Angomonas deanei]|nr:extracellular signal-regulated kinase 1/2 [Angomonas deanei]|eukprot:EPY26217.1 extracellular signal-regulated kinase 1/2 [Angomonas deanei]
MTRSGSVSPYVAIKKVPKVLDDLVDGRRILRELKILRYLSGHPNIIRVLDVMCPIFGSGIMRDIYIVTELLDTDLYALLKSHHRLELDQIRFISYQLIKALLYTHSSGVIHRDVKPANILLDGDCTAKLCDFGLARGGVFLPAESGTSEFERFRFNAYKVDEEKNENNKQFFSLTDYVVTRYYRAPELLVLGKYNHAVDMWSVGCILAEMFSRKPLFPGANYLSQLSLILETPGIGGIPANEADVDDLFEGGEEGKLFMKELLFRKEHSQYRGSPDVLRSSTIGSSTAPSEAVSLLFSLLCVNPRERPTALEALRHPFFNAVYRKEDEIIRDFSTTESDGQEQGSDEDPSSVKVDAAEPLMWGFDHQITDASSLQRMFLEEVSIYRAIKQQLLDMKK